MTARLPWVLLAASLLLNVFFAGGVIYSKMTADRLEAEPRSRLAFAAEELGLSEAETERLVVLRKTVGERRARMREDGGALTQALNQEMRRPDLDRQRLEEILRQRSKLFVAYLSDTMGEVHGYLGTLPPEKREEFLGLMEKERRFLFRLLREPRSDSSK
jgi:hypothetical protein